MDITTILIFIGLIIASAFFSGTEIALMSLPRHKIETLIKQKAKGSKDLKYIKEHSDRLLITILIGNNLVNTYTAAFATTVTIGVAKNYGMGLNQATILSITTGIVTLLLLLFGEIIPKSFATKNAEKISLTVAKFYKILMIILYPIIIFVEFITKLFTGKNNKDTISEEEIEAFIDMGKESGILEEKEHKQIKNLLDLNDTTVEEIMTPRIKIDKLSDETTIEKALEYILDHTHSRIPVYHEDIDHITGIVNMRILLNEIKKGNGNNKKLKDIKLIKPIKVPLNKPIDDLLRTFQQARQHLAIVIDEYGGVAGLVSLEDIIEEVFGEIQDETDQEEQVIKKIGKNKYEVDSSVLIEDILEKFGLELQDLGIKQKEYEGETLSYLITDILERFPHPGEKIKFNLINNKAFVIETKEVNNGIIGKTLLKLEKK